MISLSPARPLWRSVERDECSAYCVRVKTPRPVAIGLFALSALLLSGCSPEAAVPSAPPAAEGEALFASDEEALAAAEAAFAEYLDVAFAVFADGGADPQRLEEVAVGEALEADVARAADYQARGVKQTGEPAVLETRLQQFESGSEGDSLVSTYACLDGKSVDLVNESGESQGSPDRASTVTVENIFVADAAGRLMLEKSTVWASGETCEF